MNPLCTQLAQSASIELTQSQLAQLSQYLDLLLEANTRMNLTRITDRPTAEIQHIADALTLLPHLPNGPIQIADVGSGGGVPGIPIAVARPGSHLTLIESTKKKAAFLEETANKLQLKNIEIIDQRVEDVGQSNERGSFDATIVRAVAAMGWLAEWCLPLLKIGGKVLAMKGPKVDEELPKAIPTILRLGGKLMNTHQTPIPELTGHVIVEIEKIKKTPSQYPRPASEAKGKIL